MMPSEPTAQRRSSSCRTCRPILLLGALPLLMLAGCQSERLSTGSCVGAVPGSQLAIDCQYAAALTFSRRSLNTP